MCVGAAIMAGPYVAVIGKLTNKTTGNDLIEMMQGDREEPSWKPRVGEQSRNGGTALLAAWWTAEDGYQPKAVWAARALASEVFKAGHYLFPLMGLYGVWLMWRTRRGDAAVAILLCAAGFNVLILLYLATKIGYVSERHALPIACYLTIFAGPVLARIAESIGRSRSPLFSRDPVIVTALLLALFCLPGALKPLHANREGLRRAGEWLAKNMKPDEHLIDPFDWSAYYSGRTLWGFDRDEHSRGGDLHDPRHGAELALAAAGVAAGPRGGEARRGRVPLAGRRAEDSGLSHRPAAVARAVESIRRAGDVSRLGASKYHPGD